MNDARTLIITSGYFDPLHIGHVECFSIAKSLGDFHVVIINNDLQSAVKKTKTLNKPIVMMPAKERGIIIKEMRSVDDVLVSIDEDTTVCKSIEYVYNMYKDQYQRVIFAKGGDRFSYEIPEAVLCKNLGIEIKDGLGMKIQSSSEMIGNLVR